MLFWLAVAVLAAVVTFAVTRPLLQDGKLDGEPSSADVAVYKDQLLEIVADRDRGVMSDVEADAARTEIARRLLRRVDKAGATGAKKPGAMRQVGVNAKPVFTIASLALPLASLGLYLSYGEPGLPAQPLSQRLAAPAAGASTNDLIAKVEATLQKNPQDGRGWDVIAPVYLAEGRASDAASAYATAMRLLGENASRLQGFADARIRAENGVVPDDAKVALKALLAAEPQRREPRIWLALAKEQDGDRAGAAADYRALLADAPKDAPWRQAIEDRLQLVERGPVAGAPSTPAKSGSATVDARAAEVAAMSPEQRDAMIATMVTGLAERLKSEKTDLIGWQKLIRAYQVLGRKDDVAKALTDARTGLAGDEARLRQLEDWVKQLGLSG
ncbi:MAG: c-type cytochrome biogenesis protein CcmI [Hyphomicrobium sp.]|nr:c-type cytochrome biogenesis protein CcmI [Hyphomicrobium sp.]